MGACLSMLEQGIHRRLVAKEGHYTHLVQVQKLRESEEDEEVVGSDSNEVSRTEKTRLRGGSPGSNPAWTQGHKLFARQRHHEPGAEDEGDDRQEDYSLMYIFKRFGALQSEVWQRYLVGAFFICLTGMIYPSSSVVWNCIPKCGRSCHAVTAMRYGSLSLSSQPQPVLACRTTCLRCSCEFGAQALLYFASRHRVFRRGEEQYRCTCGEPG